MTDNASPGYDNGVFKRALGIPQILLAVLKALEVPDFEDLSAKDLLRAALVCKQWSTLALEKYWKTKPVSLLDLLSTLGESQEELSKPPEEVAIVSKDWARFKMCAAQVNKLDFNSGLEESELETVKKLLEDAPLCPNLRHFIINMESLEPEDDFPWTTTFQLILPSTLKTAEFSQGEQSTSESLEAAVRTLAAVAPGLEELRVLTLSADPNYGAFQRLKKAAIRGWLDHNGWQTLAKCTLLETIELHDGPHMGGTVYTYSDPEPYEIAFPQLKFLNINDEDGNQHPEFVRDIFRYSKMPLLEHLTIQVGDLDQDTIREYLGKG